MSYVVDFLAATGGGTLRFRRRLQRSATRGDASRHPEYHGSIGEVHTSVYAYIFILDIELVTIRSTESDIVLLVPTKFR